MFLHPIEPLSDGSGLKDSRLDVFLFASVEENYDFYETYQYE